MVAAQGEDVNVGHLSHSAGKGVQLELKTTTLSQGRETHSVKIDLEQLNKYMAREHYARPFYVFPSPRWLGTLKEAVEADSIPAPEAGFSRARRWFAQWMVAMTTDQVAQVLRSQRDEYRRGGQRKPALMSIDIKSGRHEWADGGQPRTIPWLQLWERLDSCGDPSWPQIHRLHSPTGHPPATIAHEDMWNWFPNTQGGELVTYGSTEVGTFELIEESPSASDDLADQEGQEDHLVAVFLDARALRPR